MKVCPLYGAHHWLLDSIDYGKCACGAEKDFAPEEKKTKRKYWLGKGKEFETEFYLQADLKVSHINRDGEWD